MFQSLTFSLLLDGAAAAIAVPTLLVDLRALRGASGQGSAIRIFRKLDGLCAHLLSTLSYVAVFYLVARAIAAAAGAAWPLVARAGAIALLLFVLVALLQPLMALYNVFGWLLWRNPAIHLEKERYFPAAARLEAQETFVAIREEVSAAVTRSRPFTDIYGGVTVVEPVAHDAARPSCGWRSLHLRIADVDIAENAAMLPTLTRLLGEMPEVVNAFVSVIDGGHRLAPHRGYFKGILRYHLGIIVPAPDDVWLVCGGERYHWREGEGIVFDDMFVHSVENRSSLPRVVLFLDVRRPVGRIGGWVRETLAWMITHHPFHVSARKRAVAR